MLKAIVLTLKSGFEIALVLSIAISYLRQLNKPHLLRPIIAGTGIAAVFGLYAAYHMKQFGGRESFEGTILAAAFVLTALLLVGTLRMFRKNAGEGRDISSRSWTGRCETAFAFLIAFALTVIPVVDLARFPYNIFIQTYSVVNSELILKFTGALAGLVLSYLFSLAFVKNVGKLSSRQFTAGTMAVGAVLLFKQKVTVLQILLATGVLPITSLTFSVILPLINLMNKYVYLLLGATAIWVILFALAFRNRTGKTQVYQNPAVLRKIKAGVRREWRWLGTVISLVVFITSLVGAETVLANRKAELSPAVPVTPADGKIHIPMETVNDRNLHRFGFTASDSTVVRFIIIRKSETSYGIAYDACDLCGNAGYYQKGSKVICRKCDVVMNIPTIGFPGGCNPIPLAFTINNGQIVIQAADLEKKKAVFQTTSVFKN